MSMDRCGCGEFVDTDEFPEAYLLTKDSIGIPKIKQRHMCVCSDCQELIEEDELEARSA